MKGFYVYKEGTKQIMFTVRYVAFTSKKAVNADTAKEMFRKASRKSKKCVAEEYDVIYGKAHATRKKLTFTTCPKPLADVIFVIPKKYRKEARKAISEVTL